MSVRLSLAERRKLMQKLGFDDLIRLPASHIEALCSKHPPYGSTVHKQVAELPRYTVKIE